MLYVWLIIYAPSDRANIQSLPVPSSVVSYALKEMVTGLDLPLSISNHLSVQSTLTCNLDLPNCSRPPAGLWKLNTSILSEEGFQKYATTSFTQNPANHL
ncbi:hypothetical protein OUZ56_033865 [Daphnia magna]|uniref:Uncharacterized protein n=1 Tax=Daphnia magna TaxID=35525 RepID=A0ABR0BB65_9CRUS|nr:hypothetical protein OUZ56_033865 [Daphnia magna]